MEQDLLRRVDRLTRTGTPPVMTDVPGLVLMRYDHQRQPNHLIMRPALCVTLQGAKTSLIGDTTHFYGAGDALVVSMEMPAIGTIIAASPSEPYLGIAIMFDAGIMHAALTEMDEPLTSPARPRNAFVSRFDGPVEACVERLVALLDRPKAIPVLYPAIMRELSYWLLSGPGGADLAAMMFGSERIPSVLTALHLLRDRFRETVRVEELAESARMSASVFHRRFKALTAMTPVQYQKRLRLIEGRRLIIGEAVNVENAAFRVGYESASQFSRDYSRMFGVPPRADKGAPAAERLSEA
ncbi:AraC family transcriptional regulator [Martelella sp. HB161492]|uniref:AraC family transcriptional regulator n=1 Tax=Martelella sp. HB161492 TaxID=2720726 RepID=UPI0015910FD4|nr:AraC family transcriptional regulator [Martelella sp. HB161492]